MATTSEVRVEDDNTTTLPSPTPDVVSKTEKAVNAEKKSEWPCPVVVNKDQPSSTPEKAKRKRKFSC